ncbi:hypothetical protein [Azospirillum sp. B4]|uniref:hypothetical protein n=1 Tax=Azospirillum sp. B4 TaxID=95605 RepID=UPI00034DB0AB|nr:hypothetical protein [Azospirillum sp. B4]
MPDGAYSDVDIAGDSRSAGGLSPLASEIMAVMAAAAGRGQHGLTRAELADLMGQPRKRLGSPLRTLVTGGHLVAAQGPAAAVYHLPGVTVAVPGSRVEKTVINALRASLAEWGWTEARLAEACGLAIETVQGVLAGQPTPKDQLNHLRQAVARERGRREAVDIIRQRGRDSRWGLGDHLQVPVMTPTARPLPGPATTCQFLEGEARERAFCGQPATAGLSYCADHAARCYLPAALSSRAMRDALRAAAGLF